MAEQDQEQIRVFYTDPNVKNNIMLGDYNRRIDLAVEEYVKLKHRFEKKEITITDLFDKLSLALEVSRYRQSQIERNVPKDAKYTLGATTRAKRITKEEVLNKNEKLIKDLSTMLEILQNSLNNVNSY